MSDQIATRGRAAKIDAQEWVTDSTKEVTFYTNVASITGNSEEFVIRHGLVSVDATGQAKVRASVYMSAAHAKRLSNLLVSTIAQYEEMLGTISIDPPRR